MTRTMPSWAASSARIRSTSAAPLNSGVAVGGSGLVGVPKRSRTALTSASQNNCGSCWSRSTWTSTSGWDLPCRCAHARNNDVFPLPAGAAMIVTWPAAARSSALSRSSRSTSRRRVVPRPASSRSISAFFPEYRHHDQLDHGRLDVTGGAARTARQHPPDRNRAGVPRTPALGRSAHSPNAGSVSSPSTSSKASLTLSRPACASQDPRQAALGRPWNVRPAPGSATVRSAWWTWPPATPDRGLRPE